MGSWQVARSLAMGASLWPSSSASRTAGPMMRRWWTTASTTGTSTSLRHGAWHALRYAYEGQ